MEPLQAVILGIIQGLTEFLPVSSSGHLVIGQNFFGLTEPAIAFDVSVHLGTLVAVIIYFAKDLAAIIRAVYNGLGRFIRKEAALTELLDEPDVRMAILIVMGSIPTALIGLFFKGNGRSAFLIHGHDGCDADGDRNLSLGHALYPAVEYRR
jgi:undecaprenyl-diphosphatase